MAGRVEEDAERGARLVFRLRRAEFEHGLSPASRSSTMTSMCICCGTSWPGHCGGRNCSTRWKQMHWSPAALRTSPQPSSELAFQSSKAP